MLGELETISCFQSKRWFAVALSMTCFGLLASACAGAKPPPAPSPKSQSVMNYPVHVEVREQKNRVVQGQVRSHQVQVDQPKAFGGDDTAPTPPETLAFALGSCVVSTGRLIATQQKLPVRSISAVVDGELDFARALGQSSNNRAGFSGFTLTVQLDGDLSFNQRANLLEEIRARCPMCDNLSSPTPIVYQPGTGSGKSLANP